MVYLFVKVLIEITNWSFTYLQPKKKNNDYNFRNYSCLCIIESKSCLH